IGNHDTQTDQGRHEIADKRRFGILGEEGYYQFSSPDGLAEFFALNSELEGDAMTRQVEWFRKQVPHSKAAWNFVFLHHPLYTIRGQRAPRVALRRQIDEAMKANRVQFVIAGHNHMYVRMKPVDDRLEIISGGGGRHLAFPRRDPCAEISARRYHFVAFEVFPENVRVTAVDREGNIFDEKVVDQAFLKTSTPGCPIR